LEIYVICLVVFLIIMGAMAIGLIMNKRIKGSCGGINGDEECSICGKTNTEEAPVIKGEEKLNRPEPTRYNTWESKGREVDF